jgi:molecular chaperone DnaK
VPRNTTLPVTAKRIFRTRKAGQQSILVQIVEGESANPDDCTQIGRCAVRDLPPNLPAQSSIDVRFHYAENGRLTVRVAVEGTDKKLNHNITRDNALTAEQLNAWKSFVCGT